MHRQPYGQPGQHIISINRRHLNEVMITEAEKFENVRFFFEHKVLKADPNKGTLLVDRLNDGDSIQVEADLILACDGAFSAVRRSLMAYPLFQFSQEYIEHGYVELNILPKNNEFALEPNVFHIWARGDFTLIALANMDKTFTVTIFAPFRLFEEQMSTPAQQVAFFKRYFPDAFPLLGQEHIVETFGRVKPLPLVSVKCDPHAFGERVLLVGDAAHAMGFEDCLVLSEVLKECGDDIRKFAPVGRHVVHSHLARALRTYSKRRVVDAHAINDLAMYNYNEVCWVHRTRNLLVLFQLKDLVNKFGYKMRKKFDLCMNRLFPQSWIPLYSMVTFNRIPYHEVIERRQRQDKILHRCRCVLVATVVGVAAFVGYKQFKGMNLSDTRISLPWKTEL
ncbi:Protein KMO-1 [Aphelenchoides avenae]|nr:Protein KMO-1 [Aphelenchus avenae]